MRFLAVLLLALASAGCMATLRQQAHESIHRGELWHAAGLLEMAIQQGDNAAWNDLGVVHERLGNRDKSIQMFVMGARWGNPMAQRNLINQGHPVPAPDLAAARAQTRAANAANTAATLQMMQSLQPRPAPFPPTIHCRSQRFGSRVDTTCD